MKQSSKAPAPAVQEAPVSEPAPVVEPAPSPAVVMPKAKQVITLPDGTIRVDL